MVKGKAKAVLSGRTLAETDEYEFVEGNVYFPPSSVNMSYFTKTDHTTHCPWKGDASYYSIGIEKTEVKNAAWYYPTPLEKAANIKDHVAFCDYNDSNRAFLQAIMARGTITLKEGQEILAEIITVHEGREVALTPSDISEADVSAYTAAASAALSPFDYEIRSTLHQRSKVRQWALVNSTSDLQTQLATIHTPEEIGFVKRMIDAMFIKNNTQRREVMAVNSNDAFKREILKPQEGAKVNGDGTQGGDKGLSHTEAQKCLVNLKTEGWIEESREGYYSLSPRALMELRSWLVETYNDGDDPDEWQPVKFCEACKDIVTIGQRCSQVACNARLHNICEAYWDSRPEKQCPRCETDWNDNSFVGQKVLTSIDQSLKEKRKRNGEYGRRRQEEEVVEEQEEEDIEEDLEDADGEEE